MNTPTIPNAPSIQWSPAKVPGATRGSKTTMRILTAAVLAIAASPAVAAPDAALMNKASGGYVYFHRASVGMAAHDAAVDFLRP